VFPADNAQKCILKGFIKYPNIRKEQLFKASGYEEKGNGRTAIRSGLCASTANKITYDLAKIRSDSKSAVTFRDHKFIFYILALTFQWQRTCYVCRASVFHINHSCCSVSFPENWWSKKLNATQTLRDKRHSLIKNRTPQNNGLSVHFTASLIYTAI
jgi:hypothetical protein